MKTLNFNHYLFSQSKSIYFICLTKYQNVMPKNNPEFQKDNLFKIKMLNIDMVCVCKKHMPANEPTAVLKPRFQGRGTIN